MNYDEAFLEISYQETKEDDELTVLIEKAEKEFESFFSRVGSKPLSYLDKKLVAFASIALIEKAHLAGQDGLDIFECLD